MKFTIKQARQYSGKTQKEMAKELGVALPTYRDYEHGKYFMRMDRAEKFSKIVEIPIESIFFTIKLHDTASKWKEIQKNESRIYQRWKYQIKFELEHADD